MLSGLELAAAFSEAMRLKKEKTGATQKVVAAAFGVTQASVSEWTKFGRIGKKHLGQLVEFFSDVVPAEHWGLHEAIQEALFKAKGTKVHSLVLSPQEMDLIASFRSLPDDEQHELVNDVMARAEGIAQVVQRELARRGIAISGFVSASRAAEALPKAPKASSSTKAKKDGQHNETS